MNWEQFGRFFIARMLEWSLIQVFTMSVWREKKSVEKEVFVSLLIFRLFCLDREVGQENDIREKVLAIYLGI